MKTSFSRLPAMLLWVAPVVGFLACANRGMEAPTESFLDASGGAAAGAGGSLSGAGGAATGGSLGAGGSAGGRTGTSGTGGSGAAPGAGGTGGTSTGGVAGGSGGSGGAVGAGGGVGTGGGGTAGAGGTSTGGVAGGTAGQGGAGGLSQLIVSIDFIGGRPATGGSGGAALVGAPALSATETAGVKPATNWNGAASNTGTLANLRTSDGSVTTATVTWNSPATSGQQPGAWTNAFTDAPGDVRMMNGYLDPTSSGSPATVKVSGLPAAIAGGYDVYVYAYGDIPDTSTRKYQYAIGTTTFTVSQTGPSTPFSGLAQSVSGGSGDYIVFRKASGATFTLTATPGTGNQSRAPINGIQIVWPSGS